MFNKPSAFSNDGSMTIQDEDVVRARQNPMSNVSDVHQNGRRIAIVVRRVVIGTVK